MQQQRQQTTRLGASSTRRFPKRNVGIALAVTTTAAVPGSAPSASAGTGQTGHSYRGSVVTDVRTTEKFDFAAGEIPENITVNPDGSTTLSMLGSCAVCQRTHGAQLMHISASGHRTVLVTGQVGEAISGNTRGNDGTVYYSLWAPGNAARNGVYKLLPDGTPRRIAALPADTSPNGLAIDPAGATLYIADSLKGIIWSAPVSGGPATPWLTDAALAPVPTEALPIGANGVKFHNDALWVSNFNKGTLLRVPVTGTGAAGPVRLVAGGLPNIDDLSFLTPRSDVVFAAQNGSSSQNGPDRVVVIYPDGTYKPVLTSADGLASPSATPVRGDRLYITDGGVPEPHDAKLQTARINFAALHANAAH
ncbi:SMP-30/gluconolactonase/LRE family protein [Streptomyces sp. IB201691-2A2]|uniref:SMP-30/gluconolactonase/LRE family protein n=1 Tax=Streptomyces sp. IB201691-2A2 TaxID=2561920 RepID=UPI0021B0D420|nr:SMP-30/gluconolactonase/LRE family protein [Streptomyces sp. IB201691-2A2]